MVDILPDSSVGWIYQGPFHDHVGVAAHALRCGVAMVLSSFLPQTEGRVTSETGRRVVANSCVNLEGAIQVETTHVFFAHEVWSGERTSKCPEVEGREDVADVRVGEEHPEASGSAGKGEPGHIDPGGLPETVRGAFFVVTVDRFVDAKGARILATRLQAHESRITVYFGAILVDNGYFNDKAIDISPGGLDGEFKVVEFSLNLSSIVNGNILNPVGGVGGGVRGSLVVGMEGIGVDQISGPRVSVVDVDRQSGGGIVGIG